MKKILIVIGSLDLGGTEKQLLKILQRLNNFMKFTSLLFGKEVLYFPNLKN